MTDCQETEDARGRNRRPYSSPRLADFGSVPGRTLATSSPSILDGGTMPNKNTVMGT
jgi:hypothetical protein